MAEVRRLSASLEDYLEAIYDIIAEKQAVRAKDLAKRLKVRQASVTGALKTLAAHGLVNYAPYDVITLTPEGEKIAREVSRRHSILREFLKKVLFVESSEADRVACLLEHGVTSEIATKMALFLEFIEECPLARKKFIEGFKRYLESQGERRPNCDECLKLVKKIILEHQKDKIAS